MAGAEQWLALNYYGPIVRDLAASGPFVLGSVALTSAAGRPNAMAPARREVFRTRPHTRTAQAFSITVSSG
ncbi:MAG: hypothetical protein NVS9B10_12050 [Nevskia sp.]